MKLKSFRFFFAALSLFIFTETQAQEFHEIGFGVGPVSFRGDWGERGDTRTNLGNTGFGLSAVHHINFAYNRNYNRYFNRHFKMRNQITFHQTTLNHYGRWQRGEDGPPGNPTPSQKLREMDGRATVIELGTGLDWFWREIRDYERTLKTFNPYAGVGVNLVYYNPRVRTSLPGNIGSVDNTFPTFLPETADGRDRISNSADLTLSLNFQAGTRYRITDEVDLFLEGRWHFFMSDFVDGLDPRGSQNKSNDWMFFLNVGFTVHLD